jgi:hypothetical protein
MKHGLFGAGIVLDAGPSVQQIIGQAGDHPDGEDEKDQIVSEQHAGVEHVFMLCAGTPFWAWGKS